MFKILSATQDVSLTERLISATDGLASVVRTDANLQAIQDSLLSVRPDMILIDIDNTPVAVTRACEAIRVLTAADAVRPVIAIGDDHAASIVLQSIRSGARDFIGRDSGTETLHNQIAAQLNRLTRETGPTAGRIVVITSGQPNEGESLFAVNYAVLRQHMIGGGLLVDFHLPATEAGPALDIDLNYTIRDAIHDLPRLDRTLLSSALGRHAESGLLVLPLSLGADNVIDITGAAILSLIMTLRSMFTEITINLGGLRHSGLVAELLGTASEFYLVASQRFTSVKACRELLARLSLDPAACGRCTLIVTDYDDEIRLTHSQMASTLGVLRAVRLPDVRAAQANALNRGVPLVLDHPRSAYTKIMSGIASVSDHGGSGPHSDKLLFGKLFHRVSPGLT
jgi:pilus assembly protein CpaE